MDSLFCTAAHACFILSAGVMRRRANGFDPLERHRTASTECHIL
ncbi:hypothetical protein X769_26690 [Mesorhizobium sp. LSJC268A00]|nr:hypothetical protein X770_29655 [Mesorhizobium sp. LSJC269B00]ESW96931.1 hypothetical protein X769_26690 [Mesorhizobium sp. LSJC268A00]ESX09141.1 hypothetical protein X768_20065 [Mesorhizobium sp. LSJC265A00]ESX15033.1 hypothetical protein X766_26400 [Mesorhizobium sp. LSJC255A00]ESX24145.1 hypothetical protein X767_12945 [Mesorhizobium sp. LSJC264A00]ESX47717.1 hypothetical protein X762_17150 [Mesorhizobium sp. LSHC426A00]ESX50765.1 hypothetical protein X761_25755 [Mesorhizobium sp. LSHC4